ncbi:MAG: hypothetical protein ABIG94_11635 [Pseudomonadota bacterium]
MDGNIPIINSLNMWRELINFQLNIAERWYRRGNEVNDIFAKFFFYFTGFNSLYSLWKKIDGISQGEGKQIENLLKKFDRHRAGILLNRIRDSVDYFTKRRPISRMDRREPSRPYSGDQEEGKKWQGRLIDNSDPLKQVVAMGQILYLIRSNLVHGSKAGSGDDHDIIQASIQPLKIILEEAIQLTQQSLRTY